METQKFPEGCKNINYSGRMENEKSFQKDGKYKKTSRRMDICLFSATYPQRGSEETDAEWQEVNTYVFLECARMLFPVHWRFTNSVFFSF